MHPQHTPALHRAWSRSPVPLETKEIPRFLQTATKLLSPGKGRTAQTRASLTYTFNWSARGRLCVLRAREHMISSPLGRLTAVSLRSFETREKHKPTT